MTRYPTSDHAVLPRARLQNSAAIRAACAHRVVAPVGRHVGRPQRRLGHGHADVGESDEPQDRLQVLQLKVPRLAGASGGVFPAAGQREENRLAGHQAAVALLGREAEGQGGLDQQVQVVFQAVRDGEVPHRGGDHVAVEGLELLRQGDHPAPGGLILPGGVLSVQDGVLGIQRKPVERGQVGREQVDGLDLVGRVRFAVGGDKGVRDRRRNRPCAARGSLDVEKLAHDLLSFVEDSEEETRD